MVSLLCISSKAFKDIQCNLYDVVSTKWVLINFADTSKQVELFYCQSSNSNFDLVGENCILTCFKH